jgi:hypothetical protein
MSRPNVNATTPMLVGGRRWGRARVLGPTLHTERVKVGEGLSERAGGREERQRALWGCCRASSTAKPTAIGPVAVEHTVLSAAHLPPCHALPPLRRHGTAAGGLAPFWTSALRSAAPERSGPDTLCYQPWRTGVLGPAQPQEHANVRGLNQGE